MPSMVKMGQQYCGSTARLFPTLLIPTLYLVISGTTWDGSFGRFTYGTAEVLISLLNIGGTRRSQALGGFIGEEAVVIQSAMQKFHHFTGSLGTGVTSFAAVLSKGHVETKETSQAYKMSSCKTLLPS